MQVLSWLRPINSSDKIRVESRKHFSRSRTYIEDHTFALAQKRERRAWHLGRHCLAIVFPEAGEALETKFGEIEYGERAPVVEYNFKCCHEEI
jgi:hypothetical protein